MLPTPPHLCATGPTQGGCVTTMENKCPPGQPDACCWGGLPAPPPPPKLLSSAAAACGGGARGAEGPALLSTRSCRCHQAGDSFAFALPPVTSVPGTRLDRLLFNELPERRVAGPCAWACPEAASSRPGGGLGWGCRSPLLQWPGTQEGACLPSGLLSSCEPGVGGAWFHESRMSPSPPSSRVRSHPPRGCGTPPAGV